MSLANVSIVGNLARKPEQMFFSSGRKKTTLIVAVNNPFRASKSVNDSQTNSNKISGDESGKNNGNQSQSSTADFYKVEVWGKLSDLAAAYLDKGNQITVTGRLTFDRWLDKQGKERVTAVVEANQIAFPPRLRVVAQGEMQATTISGEVDVTDATHNPLAQSVVSEAQVCQVEIENGEHRIDHAPTDCQTESETQISRVAMKARRAQTA